MSNTSIASDLARPARRSTRINKAVPITVMGVDSVRSPYLEDVSTVDFSCHGCRYESKHDVVTNSWVMLELPAKENNGETVSARGLVKWVKPPQDTNGVYETAIELDDPANIWGIDSPPQDWVTFSESRLEQAPALKAKPFAVPRPETQPEPPIAEKSVNERPVNLLVGQFHEQMERALLDAADAAVRERASSTLDEVRHGLCEEAKRVLAEAASSQTGPWMDQSLKQLNEASLKTAKMLHGAWAKRLEVDTGRAIEHFEERSREFNVLAQSLSANALDRLQRSLESTMAGLVKQGAEFQSMLDQSVAKSTARIEESCMDSGKQFEMIIHERLDAAREDIESVIRSATSAALDNFAASAQEQQAEQQSRLRDALQPIAETALNDLKEKAASCSSEFARAISDRSRTHLEFVSSSIAEAAKAVGKLPSE